MNLLAYDTIHPNHNIEIITDKEELEYIKEALETMLLEYPSHNQEKQVEQTIQHIKNILREITNIQNEANKEFERWDKLKL